MGTVFPRYMMKKHRKFIAIFVFIAIRYWYIILYGIYQSFYLLKNIIINNNKKQITLTVTRKTANFIWYLNNKV